MTYDERFAEEQAAKALAEVFGDCWLCSESLVEMPLPEVSERWGLGETTFKVCRVCDPERSAPSMALAHA
jgi:hypothetical protein